MPSWTHLIRFIAVEDSLVHLGQLVDTSRDIGRDSVDSVEIAAFVIEGSIFDGRVTKEVMHVKQVRHNHNFVDAVFNAKLHSTAPISHFSRGMQLYQVPWTELLGPCKGKQTAKTCCGCEHWKTHYI